MAEDIKYVSGVSGAHLAYYDGTAWKPVMCLTDTSYQQTLATIEKVNACTNGETHQSPGSITRSVSINGEVIDTTEVGGTPVGVTIDELYSLQDDSQENKTQQDWRLDRGPFGYKYFKGVITDASDNYTAGEDATFSATLSINGKPTDEDPYATGG